jgi:hypothetical protein
MRKTNWRKIKCDFCHQKLDHELDLVIWNEHYEGEEQIIDELSFRHGCGRGCDSKSFLKSRHMKDGFDDLLEKWRTK